MHPIGIFRFTKNETVDITDADKHLTKFNFNFSFSLTVLPTPQHWIHLVVLNWWVQPMYGLHNSHINIHNTPIKAVRIIGKNWS